ncbi:MAG: SAF domain-containing protein [Coprococcus sp.]
MIPRREARRSLVLTHDMKAGEVIAEKDLIAKRPGTGISPKYIDIVIGQSLKKDLKEDTVLSWENI